MKAFPQKMTQSIASRTQFMKYYLQRPQNRSWFLSLPLTLPSIPLTVHESALTPDSRIVLPVSCYLPHPFSHKQANSTTSYENTQIHLPPIY